MNLFIVSINYQASLKEIDAHMKEHMVFLKEYYASGHFLVSGRKVPRTGGIVIVKGKDEKEIERIMKSDPFCKKKLATITITEFQASQQAEILKEFFRKK